MRLLISLTLIMILNSCGVPLYNPAFYLNGDKTIRDVMEHKKGRNIGPWTYTINQRDKIN